MKHYWSIRRQPKRSQMPPGAGIKLINSYLTGVRFFIR